MSATQGRDAEYRAIFQREAVEVLAELETALMELESSPEDRSLVDRVFRSMHTLKGSGAMFGFEDISGFTHEVESVFDQVRQGRVSVGQELVDLGLRATDHVTRMLNVPEEADPAVGQDIIAGLRALTGAAASQSASQAAQPAQAAGPAAAPAAPAVAGATEETCSSGRIFRIRFKPAPDIFLSGSDPLALLDELRELGDCRVMLHAAGIPDLKEMNPELCHVRWDILLHTEAEMQAVRDVFIFVEDGAELTVEELPLECCCGDGSGDEEYHRLGRILLERRNISTEDLQQALAQQLPLGQILVNSGTIDAEQLHVALTEQRMVREVRENLEAKAAAKPAHGQQAPEASVRVEAAKLDALVDLVGELVIVQARLSQSASRCGDHVLSAVAEDLERLAGDLRDKALGLRMLPIGTTFPRFRRLIRDLSRDLGKEVEFVATGGETELDKTMIERLGDPLVHMLRNSLDHGLETPDERSVAGKRPMGTIRMDAAQSGGEVLVRLSDDGKGIDLSKLREKAIAKGSPLATAPDEELVNLIFEPGLSTAKQVTSVSGRGVGMDVVRESVRALGGRIEVQTTLGKGTSITIRLPLTMAIISGLEVSVAGEGFVIPLATVEECVELDNDWANRTEGASRQQLLEVRGQIVPYVHLDDWFGFDAPRPRREQVVVVNHSGQRVGLVVREVLGECQAVIKSLGRMYQRIEGVSGATVNGDGSLALIVDVAAIVANAAGAQPSSRLAA